MKSTTSSSPLSRALRGVGAAVSAGLLMMTAACGGGGGADAAGTPSTVSIGYAYAPETFDPMYANAGAQVSAHMHAIYGALIERDAQGVERPGMAKSWEWEDAQTLRFDLRPDVTFTDGEAFDAEAVKKWLDYGRTAPDTPYVDGAPGAQPARPAADQVLRRAHGRGAQSRGAGLR
jgi:peptide/nickel transport system substrate-binding protein